MIGLSSTCTLYLPHVVPHPADPTLTTDNLMVVVKGIENCWDHLSSVLHLPRTKMNEIQSLYHSDHQRMVATLDYYLKHHPTPSQKEVAEARQRMKQADEVFYYVRGMNVNHITCLVLTQAGDGQLWYFISISK